MAKERGQLKQVNKKHMKFEGMDREEQRRMEISRSKSDEELLDEGAVFTESGQMVVSEKSFDKIESSSADKEAKIEKLSGQDFEKSMRRLEEEVAQHARGYNMARVFLQRKSKLGEYLTSQLNPDESPQDNTYLAQHKADMEEARSVSYAQNMNSAEYVVGAVLKFAEQYRLEIPAGIMGHEAIIENFSPDRLLQMVVDAKDAELYRAHEALGK